MPNLIRAPGDALTWVAGADRDILDQCRAPDRAAYIGLGGAVITTTTLAAVAATLTLKMLDVDNSWAVIGGITWGLFIFNLDRLLIAGVRRRDSPTANFATLVPRLALAVLLGIVIAEPLMLTIFEPEITAEIELQNREDAAAFETSLAQDPRFTEIPALREKQAALQDTIDGTTTDTDVLQNPEIVALTAQLVAKDAELADAEQAVICEREGTCGSGRPGAGPAWREKLERRDRIRTERDQLTAAVDQRKTQTRTDLDAAAQAQRTSAAAELEDVQQRLTGRETERDEQSAAYASANNNSDGLAARIGALDTLANNDNAVRAALWTLRLVIIVLDSLAVLAKFLMMAGPRSTYEKRVATTETLEATLTEEQHRQEAEIIRLDASTDLTEAQTRHDLDKEIAKRVAAKTADAQEHIADKIITGWERRTLNEVDANLDSFIS